MPFAIFFLRPLIEPAASKWAADLDGQIGIAIAAICKDASALLTSS
jgi:hypothetical protein